MGTPVTSQSSQPKSNISQPIVIGNIDGANLLAAVVRNEQEPSQTSVSDLTPLIYDPFINVMPLVIQNPTSTPIISKNSKSTLLVSQVYDTNQLHDMHKPQEFLNMPLDNAKTSVIGPESELGSRVPLSSLDTIILSSDLLNPSKTLPISPSISDHTDDSVLKNILTSNKSSASSVSLLTNISDRSVSLESIPSLGLFQPDHESVSNISFYKSDSGEIISRKITPGPMYSDNASSPASSAITVIGSNKIPQSIILLVKQHLNHKFPSCNKHICLITSPEQNECNHSALHMFAEQAINDHDYNSNRSAKRQIDVDDENHSDTDMHPEEVSLASHKPNDLSRSDTVILNVSKDRSVVCSDPQFHSSDAIVLAYDGEKEVHSNERLSEGFSITSTNSTASPSSDGQLIEPSINKHRSLEIINNSLLNQSLIPFPMSVLENGYCNKSLYVVTNEGHLAAVRYISPDQLDVMQLNQLRLLNNAHDFPQVLPPNPSDDSSRSVEAKETQTELIFGTNALYFKLVDAEHDENVCSVGHLSSTILTKSPPIQQSSILSTAVLNDRTVPADQPRSSEKFKETVISLVEPAANETVLSCSLQTVSQGPEFSIASLQTPQSGLPDTSAGDDIAPNTCIECQEIFKTKLDLVSHEKTHRSGFKCGLCNAKFTRVGNFNRHRKIHNLQPENQNAFKCNDCGREFLQRCDLKRHLLIHTKQEPHRCEQCGKGYIRRSDLVVHMRFHNKDKAFKCTMCDKKFFQTGDLGRHVRHAHMPNSQLTCGHCNRKYACESTLIRHMKAVHKDIILHTVNQKMQESDSSGNSPSVNTKDVLFTMTKSPCRKH